MKPLTQILATIILTLVVSATLSAQPRYVERNSTAPENDLKRTTVTGKIESIQGSRATLKNQRGENITVNLGPQWYWQEKGYNLREGCEVTVSGWGNTWDDDGGFMFAGSIWGPGFSFELWNSEGYPRWADDRDYYHGWQPDYGWCDNQWRCEPPRYSQHYYRPCPPPPPRNYCWTPPRHHYDHYRPHHRRGCR
jgi:hypothetical protein